MLSRRFSPPWTVEEQAACFVVRDANGQQLAYVYFEDEPGSRSAAKLLSRDEARRITAKLAKLPDLLGSILSTAACVFWRLVPKLFEGSRSVNPFPEILNRAGVRNNFLNNGIQLLSRDQFSLRQKRARQFLEFWP
jgi:hypothetical protein